MFEFGNANVILLKRVELVGDLHFPVPRNDNLLVSVPVNGVADDAANLVCLITFSIVSSSPLLTKTPEELRLLVLRL